MTRSENKKKRKKMFPQIKELKRTQMSVGRGEKNCLKDVSQNKAGQRWRTFKKKKKITV